MTKQVFINNQSKKWKTSIKSLLIAMILSLVFTSVSFAEGGGRYQEDPWSFGVMADTQWTVWDEYDSDGNLVFDGDPSGENPENVSAAIARAIENQFIDAGVKLVIQVGDLTDGAGDAGMDARAAAAQPLISSKIGFFPLRGNHETYGNLYGRDPELDMNIPAFLAAFPQTQGISNTFGATNFSSPPIDEINGLSYSFDYNNTTFVIVDVEATSYWEKYPAPYVDSEETVSYPPYDYIWWVVYQDTEGILFAKDTWFRVDSSGNPSTNFYGFDATYPVADWASPSAPKMVSEDTEFWPGDQQDWISEELDKATRGTEHAFVFSHRGLMGANHADGLFGSNPGSKADTQIPFYSSLADNGVKYMISGHDHLHNRAIVSSPESADNPGTPGGYQVEQIISMAGSTKFYGPNTLDNFAGTKGREKQISQDLYNIGYYVYNVDGPRVTVDYYADSEGNFLDGEDYPHGDDSVNGRLYLPNLDFVKKETFGYSTNGKQFLVAQGDSYSVVKDRFHGTKARIISGTNNSTTTDETPYKETLKQDTDDQGNLLFEPALDENDNYIYEQDEDDFGNPLFVKVTNEDGSLIDDDLVYPVYVQDTDEDENIIYVQATDIDGNVIDEEGNIIEDGVLAHPVYEPVMVMVMEPVMVTDEILSAPRALTKTVNTGWVSRKVDPHKLVSDILSLWGMAELGTDTTDTYVLSMKHDFRKGFHGKNCNVAIATYVDGEWVNAVDENFGGEKRFVYGKYRPQYGLGTYGIDPKSKTAWAVLNYNADFAVVKDIKPAPAPKHKKCSKKMAKR